MHKHKINIILSIVVPVYNLENCISKCIDSVFTSISDDFEVIIINDGSTDDSLKVSTLLSNKYKNVVIINQENQGVSEARWAGVNKSRGRYIWFVDGDDYLVDNAVDIVLDLLKTKNPNILWFNYYSDNISQNNVENLKFNQGYYGRNKLIDSVFPKLVCDSCCNHVSNTLWDKVFLRSLVIKNFNSNNIITIGEDYSAVIPAFLNCNSLYIYNKPLYVYSTNNNSATHLKLPYSLQEPQAIWDHIYMKSNNNFKYIKDQLPRKLTHSIFNRCVSQFYSSDSYSNVKHRLNDYINSKFCNEILLSTYFKKPLKAKLMLLFLRKKWYFLLYLYSKLWK